MQLEASKALGSTGGRQGEGATIITTSGKNSDPGCDELRRCAGLCGAVWWKLQLCGAVWCRVVPCGAVSRWQGLCDAVVAGMWVTY